MTDINSIQVKATTTALDAMAVIQDGASQIALVINEEGVLIGTLTDGDIRRGILRGQALNEHVVMFMNKDFCYVRKGVDQADVLDRMAFGSIHHMPVLDKDGRAVELLTLDEIITPSQLPSSVIIMAGGKGTRLYPRTLSCPKPMLKVGDKPMLEIIIERCISNGFKSFYISVNYLKEQIIDYFGDGSSWGISIKYLVEDAPLGTAGSLQLLREKLDHPFIVINGDVLTRFKPSALLRFHAEQSSDATICVHEHFETLPFGVVKAHGSNLESFEEKPTYRYLVNAGIYVLDPSLLPLLPSHKAIDMPTFLEIIQKENHRVSVFPIHEYWLDVGRPESLRHAEESWNNLS